VAKDANGARERFAKGVLTHWQKTLSSLLPVVEPPGTICTNLRLPSWNSNLSLIWSGGAGACERITEQWRAPQSFSSMSNLCLPMTSSPKNPCVLN
jgi:hypothetical protein